MGSKGPVENPVMERGKSKKKTPPPAPKVPPPAPRAAPGAPPGPPPAPKTDADNKSEADKAHFAKLKKEQAEERARQLKAMSESVSSGRDRASDQASEPTSQYTHARTDGPTREHIRVRAPRGCPRRPRQIDPGHQRVPY